MIGRFIFSLAFIVAATEPSWADPVDAILERISREGHIPGLAVAIIQNGKIVRTATYGQANTELAVATSKQTRFQIASTTKLYTSALLMQMVEQHAIALSDPITKYIEGAPAAWKAITIRDLASHISGLGVADIDPSVTRAIDAVAVLMKSSAHTVPGRVAQYGSLDFTVLQAVLERAGGEPFATLLKKRLLSPTGLSCTSFDNAEQVGPQRSADPVPNRAEYYHWSGTENQRAWFLYTQYAYAAGGAYSCITDLARFISTIDAGKLLKQASLEAAWTPPKLSDGTSGPYGLGWVVKSYRGVEWVGHSGGPALSDIMYFPTRHLGIVVLTNQQRLYPQLASLIADNFISPPSFYASRGIDDTKPALTDLARKFLISAANGALNPTLLRAKERAEIADDWNSVAPGWIGLLGPLTDIVLTKDSRFTS